MNEIGLDPGKKIRTRGRKSLEVKCDVPVVSYYNETQVNEIKEYGKEIDSSSLSNTVRNIVVKFFKIKNMQSQE